MNKALEMEIKVGLFVSIGTGLIMLAILILGGTENFFRSQKNYTVYFSAVDGLIPGAKVVLGGVNVGTVKVIDFNPSKRAIRVVIAVAGKNAEWIRQDTYAEIATQGILGDKYVSLSMGTAEQPALPAESEIPPHQSKDLSQFLSKGDQLMVRLTSVMGSLDQILKNFEAGNRSETFFQGISHAAKNFASASDKLQKGLDEKDLRNAIKNLNQIMEKINQGSGTVGALINDPALYDDLKALLGGANRNRIMRNLVRQTIKKSAESTPAQK